MMKENKGFSDLVLMKKGIVIGFMKRIKEKAVIKAINKFIDKHWMRIMKTDKEVYDTPWAFNNEELQEMLIEMDKTFCRRELQELVINLSNAIVAEQLQIDDVIYTCMSDVNRLMQDDGFVMLLKHLRQRKLLNVERYTLLMKAFHDAKLLRIYLSRRPAGCSEAQTELYIKYSHFDYTEQYIKEINNFYNK